MVRLYLATLCGLLCLLVPRPVAAAPPPQTVKCNVADITGNIPLVTDLTGYSVYKAAITIDNIPVELRICAPRAAAANAYSALNTLVDALPRLHAHAGLRFEGRLTREMLLLNDNELPYYIDGMVDERGIIYLKDDSYDWTVVHEGAHYWANNTNFAELWMIEGYAEYLTELVMIDLGRPERVGPPPPACAQVPLITWSYTMPRETVRCGYEGGAAVFRDLAQAVGKERLQQTLFRLSDGSQRITSWGLFTALEQQDLNQDLTPIMQRVFPPAALPDLEQRQFLRNQLRDVVALAQQLQVELPQLPAIIQAIDTQDFPTATAWLSSQLPLLQVADTVTRRCAELDLLCTHPWQPLPATPEAMQALADELHQVNTALLDKYALLETTAQSLDMQVPPTVKSAVSELRLATIDDVQFALDIAYDGMALEQDCTQLNVTCAPAWRNRWSMGDMPGAQASITQQQILLQRATALEVQCEQAGWPCARQWRTLMDNGDVDRVEQHIKDVNTALSQMTATEESLTTLLRAASPPLGHLFLLGVNRDAPLAASREAFARGDLEHAIMSATNTHQHIAWRLYQLPLLTLRTTTIALLLVIILALIDFQRYRRRHNAQAVQNDALLANLLAQAPDDATRSGR